MQEGGGAQPLRRFLLAKCEVSSRDSLLNVWSHVNMKMIGVVCCVCRNRFVLQCQRTGCLLQPPMLKKSVALADWLSRRHLQLFCWALAVRGVARERAVLK